MSLGGAFQLNRFIRARLGPACLGGLAFHRRSAAAQGTNWQLPTTTAVLLLTTPQLAGVPRTSTGSPGASFRACSVASSTGSTQTSSLGGPSMLGTGSFQPTNSAA